MTNIHSIIYHLVLDPVGKLDVEIGTDGSNVKVFALLLKRLFWYIYWASSFCYVFIGSEVTKLVDWFEGVVVDEVEDWVDFEGDVVGVGTWGVMEVWIVGVTTGDRFGEEA